MKSGLRIAQRIDFDHAAHLASVLGGKARGVDRHRVDIVGADLRTKAGRTIVGQRNAIDHKLRLILGAARMQHGIAFVEPARLRVHQVLDGAARQRCQPLSECRPS